MVYCSTGSLERLMFHPNNNLNERHWVDLEMSNCDATFEVTICCDEDWSWEFYYDKTNYDLVKHVIMDCIFSAESVDDLIDSMDEAFEEFFSEIVVDWDEPVENKAESELTCDGDCDNCKCRIVNECDDMDDVEIEVEADDDDINKMILKTLKRIDEKLDKGV